MVIKTLNGILLSLSEIEICMSSSLSKFGLVCCQACHYYDAHTSQTSLLSSFSMVIQPSKNFPSNQNKNPTLHIIETRFSHLHSCFIHHHSGTSIFSRNFIYFLSAKAGKIDKVSKVGEIDEVGEVVDANEINEVDKVVRSTRSKRPTRSVILTITPF